MHAGTATMHLERLKQPHLCQHHGEAQEGSDESAVLLRWGGVWHIVDQHEVAIGTVRALPLLRCAEEQHIAGLEHQVADVSGRNVAVALVGNHGGLVLLAEASINDSLADQAAVCSDHDLRAARAGSPNGHQCLTTNQHA